MRWTTKLAIRVRSRVAAGLPTGYSRLCGNLTGYCCQQYRPRLDNRGGNGTHHGLCCKQVDPSIPGGDFCRLPTLNKRPLPFFYLLVSFCQFVLKILSKHQIPKSIKGRNSVGNLRKTMIYNTNVDLVNDNVYTKFGLNRSLRFQDIEQKLNSDVNQGPLLCCKFAEIRTHPSFHACPGYLQE